MKTNESNRAIRDAVYNARLTNYQAAELCGMSETTWYRRMRRELPRETQDEIVAKIKDAAEK